MENPVDHAIRVMSIAAGGASFVVILLLHFL